MIGKLLARGPLSASALFAVWAAVVAVMVALPLVGVQPYATRQIELVAIHTLIALGLCLTFGYAGELSLGHVAMYAIGAYAAGYVSMHLGSDLILGVLAGILGAVLLGFVSGVPALRLGAWTLAITTLFMVVLIPDFVQLFPDSVLGGTLGLTSIPVPTLFGVELTETGMYMAIVVATAVMYGCFRNLVRSPYGSMLLTLRASPELAASLGVPVYRLKLVTYAVSAIPAGVGGALLAYLDAFVAPAVFTLELTIFVLAAVIIGGSISVYGPVIGVAILQFGLERSASSTEYSLAIYGSFLIVCGVFARAGVAGLFRSLMTRLRSRTDVGEAGLIASPVSAQVGSIDLDLPGERLVVRDLHRSFGGVKAVNGVSFVAEPGQITAVIGPNGSGKTTVLNLLSGFYAADEGEVTLGKRQLSGMRAHDIARRGVARTFQTPLVPQHLTVDQIIESAMFASNGTSMIGTIMRSPAYRRRRVENDVTGSQITQRLGLAKLGSAQGSELALGTRRLLELARSVAGRPSLILLDEAAAGLDGDEIDEFRALLQDLRSAGATVVLVEHNFSLVREVADKIIVLADGGILASGTPDEVENSPEVMERYLGAGAAITGSRGRSDSTDGTTGGMT